MQQTQRPPETNWQKLRNCAPDHYGLDEFDHSDIAVGEFAAEDLVEAPILIGSTPLPKPFVSPGSIAVTDVYSECGLEFKDLRL